MLRFDSRGKVILRDFLQTQTCKKLDKYNQEFPFLEYNGNTIVIVKKNLNPKFVSDLVGHSSTKVIMDRYAHLINPMSAFLADSLEGLVSP